MHIQTVTIYIIGKNVLFQVTRAKQKMDGAIDELKLKLKTDNDQQTVDLYNREKNMIVGQD